MRRGVCFSFLFFILQVDSTAYKFIQYQTAQRANNTISISSDTRYEVLKSLCDSLSDCVAFDTSGALLNSSSYISTTEWITSICDAGHPTTERLAIAKEKQVIYNGLVRSYIHRHGDVTVTVSPNIFDDLSFSSKVLTRAVKRYKRLIFSHTIFEEETSIFKSQPSDVQTINIICPSQNETLGPGMDESYSLTITESSIRIKAENVFAIMHALETLSQMITYNFDTSTYDIANAPWKIEDDPDFEHRGILIDTSRHFQPVSILKKLIESLSYAKFNVLHWHVVDANSFPMEVKSYPKLWQGAYRREERYTQAEISHLVNYARDHGIRVMVEFDNPAHTYAWGIGYPDILPEGWQEAENCPNTCPNLDCDVPMDPVNPLSKQRQIVSGVIREATTLFPENLLHLGGDEVPLGCWNKSSTILQHTIQYNKTLQDLYLEFVQASQRVAVDQGRTPVNWEEVYVNFGTLLDPRVIVHVWLSLDTVRRAAQDGYRVIVSNGWWYLDHWDNDFERYYRNELLYNVTEELRGKVIGGEVCMWGERMDSSQMLRLIWPKAAGAAERLWNYNEAEGQWALEKALPRLRRFRCLLIDRGISADAVYSWANPAHPSACMDT
ncbi:beta-hexosaminidase 2 [Planoprotostelium fungivorum]|uniref:beta-N-acetylhexosaminidase n=1 Tax=Planoprotostelium fungivorum TaxID=1890364 RepID=A0A2P6NJU0_9EUKA|nr:beta-hexosaminidase 2 [Planoprotostelium fungivorum]